jgi:transcriptional antiterminator NusG
MQDQVEEVQVTLEEVSEPLEGQEPQEAQALDTEVVESALTQAPEAETKKSVEDVAPEEVEPEEPVEEAAAEEAEEDGRAWYVVHTYSGYEKKVKRNLEHRIEALGMQDRIFQIVIPVEEEVDIREGQRRIVERKIFPGYILVQMVMNDETWSLVRHTPGVTGFVGSSPRPVPLSQEEVDRILRRMEAEEPKVRVSFRKGQTVRIVDGPFADFHGVVDDIDTERGKVRLLVSFFGRETPVELDFTQVEKS